VLFVLVFGFNLQPIFSSGTRWMGGIEALVRLLSESHLHH
jgi:hypothetical protein